MAIKILPATRSRLLFWMVMALAAFMLFGWLGTGDVNEWDEARNGANAWEMLRRGDPINLWYAGELDTWNAKPPLVIWLIAGSYRLFGYNEWALRLPSAIAGLLFFAVFFKLVRRIADEKVAAMSCVILLCCKAVISHHVFRTGDFDGPLVLFVTAALYFSLRYLEDSQRWAAVAAGAMLGLAFLTKGPAGFILVPGMFCYVALRGELKRILRMPAMWVGIAVVATVVTAWLAAVARWGIHSPSSFYGTDNSVETTLIHDVWRRITEKNFSGEWDHNPAFFLLNLEARMNLWHIVFYVGAAVAIYKLWVARRNLLAFLRRPDNRAVLLCVCLVLPVALLLTVAQGAHDWYAAPVLPWVAVLIAVFIRWTVAKWRPVRWIWLGMALFTGTRHAYYLATPRQQLKTLFLTQAVRPDDTLLLTTPPRQHLFLYILWHSQKTTVVPSKELIQYSRKLALLDKRDATLDSSIFADTVWQSEEYYLLRIATGDSR